ncbi:MAG: UvrD-helicase domain-containing protein, partial [Desulfobacterales bacterium]|nr:UvrD-helicase domain-containing protein [Desulfobacterales bacterium]
MTKKEDHIADAHQREQALDPAHSFIVQAPAGSGKTELLIQRYLRLLALVDSPEEIIAITFTRKAAAEMKNRILTAFERAGSAIPPEAPHELKTWELARSALRNNDRRKWMLAENPMRLKIQTIDSLCAGLTRQMPILSEFGAQPGIIDDAAQLYRQAARNTIADLESGLKWSPAVEALIRHLDNHLEKVEGLIAGMLAKRDQWLRHVAGKEQRQALEDALKNLIQEALGSIRRQIPESDAPVLIELGGFAAGNLKQWGISSPIRELEGLSGLPAASPEEKTKWLGMAELFLTKEGQWRKSVNKNIGFPAPSSVKAGSETRALYQEKKNLFEEYVDGLSAKENLAEALHNVRFLPDATYSDAQWHIMEALFEILRVAVGRLELVFGESGHVDFAE